MLSRASILFFLWTMPAGNLVLAQSNAYYPDFLSVYFYNMATVNPGYIPSEGRADFAGGYKFRTGAFKDISSFSFSGAKIFRKDLGPAQALRAILYNEQQGPYINMPRGYLNYAISLPITEDTRIFSGACLGMAGIYFSAPSATTSILLPDGAVGLGLAHRNTSAGVSAFQVFNQEVTPLLATLRLARYYQFYVNSEKELGLDWKLKGYVLWRLLPGVPDEVSLGGALVYREGISVGAVYRYPFGTSFFGTFEVDSGKDKLWLSFCLNTAAFSPSLRLQNSMELSLAFQVR